jgi:hypothetical protein
MSKPDISIDTIENQDSSFLDKKLDKLAETILPVENEIINTSNNEDVILEKEILEKTNIAEKKEDEQEEVLLASIFPKKIPKPKDLKLIKIKLMVIQ